MPTVKLPPQLALPILASGNIVCKVMLDLTAYLTGPSVEELEYLIDLYESVCPSSRLVKYKIAGARALVNDYKSGSDREWALGIGDWNKSAISSTSACNRIQMGRAFEIRFWDGREIDNPEGSWSFTCRRIHNQSTGLHAFVRILLPLQSDYEILRTMAIAVADRVELFSGHGGLVFVYNPWLKGMGFDHIYAKARRFWGVDIEDLNITLPLMKEGIKGISWISILSRSLSSENDMQKALSRLANINNVVLKQNQHGSVVIIGSQPVAGDQNRLDRTLDPYFSVAKEIEPLFIKNHLDFSGDLFIKNQNTLGWIRRFIDPNGWQ